MATDVLEMSFLATSEPFTNFDATTETLSDVRDGNPNRPPRQPFNRPVPFVGVCFSLRGWYARIWTGTRWSGLGYWPTASDAAREYDRAARAMYGPFVRQNFPLAPGIAPSCDPEAEGRAADLAFAPRPRMAALACWALLLLMPHMLLGIAVPTVFA